MFFQLAPRYRWFARVSHEGKRIGIYRKTHAEVKKALKELQLKQHQGLQLVNSYMLLKDYLPEWIEVHKSTLRASTVDGYNAMLNRHIIPKLGRYRLNALTPEVITKAWNTMLKELIRNYN